MAGPGRDVFITNLTGNQTASNSSTALSNARCVEPFCGYSAKKSSATITTDKIIKATITKHRGHIENVSTFECVTAQI